MPGNRRHRDFPPPFVFGFAWNHTKRRGKCWLDFPAHEPTLTAREAGSFPYRKTKSQMATEEFPKKELETLWAPWRVEYFEKEPRSLNFLSEAAQASDDAAHLVITRRKNAFLMMN